MGEGKGGGGEKESWKNVKCGTWKQMPVQSAGRQLDIVEEGRVTRGGEGSYPPKWSFETQVALELR